VLLGALLLFAPSLVWACPGCIGQDSEKVYNTYFWSTIVLSFLPFGILGAIGMIALYFRRLGKMASVDVEHALGEPQVAPHSA